MKGKNGNLIMTLNEGSSVSLDGPGTIIIKKVKKKRATIVVNAASETTIIRESKEAIDTTKGAKE